MLKYLSKFTIDILPSIIATIVGAYIVTHYINPKDDGGKPVAAVSSTPDSAIDSKAAVASPAEKSVNIVPPKARVEKASIDKPEKESVSLPAPGRHQPVVRDRPVAKAPPAAVTPPVATVSIAPVVAPPPSTPEERRDANDLARAAIERLRAAKEAPPAAQEATKPSEPPHIQEAVRSVPAPTPAVPAPSSVSAPAPISQPLQQLPPPITVSTPAETYVAPSRPPYVAERAPERRGPVPPADIPAPPPLDLEADSSRANGPDRTNVAEDVLSAAKSVFHSVIPK